MAGRRRRIRQGPARLGLSALTLAALRATREAGGSLAEAAGEMDRAILGFGDPSMFVTALLARWNYADSTLEWLTSAIPSRAASRRAASSTISAARCCPPLGLLSGQPFALMRVTLRPGDRVVFYSDGVIERRSGDDRLGIDGLHAHIRSPPSRRRRRC